MAKPFPRFCVYTQRRVAVFVKRAKTLELPVADGLEVLDVAFVEILDWDVERHISFLWLAVGGEDGA